MTLPKISVWSQFRNSAGEQIERYRKQINALKYPPELLRLYLCEGDSDDGTWAELVNWAADDRRVVALKHDTGIPHYAHSTRLERMQAVSRNGNKGWDRIAEDGWGDLALMLESDLLYEPDLLTRLIERKNGADILAPMIWIQVDGLLRFYDVWAFRRNGRMFGAYPPAWYAKEFDGVIEADSVGSVVLFGMDVIRAGLRLTEDECILGLCNQARGYGYRVYVDTETHVIHPSIQGIK